MFPRRSCQPWWGLHCFLWREESLVWVQNIFTKRFFILNFLMNKGWQRAPPRLCSPRDYSPLSRQSWSWLSVCGEHSCWEAGECPSKNRRKRNVAHSQSRWYPNENCCQNVKKHCGYTSFPSSFPLLHYCCALLHSSLLRVSVLNHEIIKTCSKITEGLLYIAK